jgi:hypothetical protein
MTTQLARTALPKKTLRITQPARKPPTNKRKTGYASKKKYAGVSLRVAKKSGQPTANTDQDVLAAYRAAFGRRTFKRSGNSCATRNLIGLRLHKLGYAHSGQTPLVDVVSAATTRLIDEGWLTVARP